MGRLRRCGNSFDGQAKIIKWTVLPASRVLDRATHKSHFGRKPDRFRHHFRRVAKSLLQICGDGQVRRLDNHSRVPERLIARQFAIVTAHSTGSCSARGSQGFEAQGGKNLGGTHIPRIRNYEGAGAVVKRAETSCLLVLSDAHGISPLRWYSTLMAYPLHREFAALAVAGFGAPDRLGRRSSAPAGSQVVRIPGLQATPLGGGTADLRRSRPRAIGTEILRTFDPLRPAGRRVLPRLLPPVDRQVEQPIAVVHRLDAANRRPVGLIDPRPLS